VLKALRRLGLLSLGALLALGASSASLAGESASDVTVASTEAAVRSQVPQSSDQKTAQAATSVAENGDGDRDDDRDDDSRPNSAAAPARAAARAQRVTETAEAPTAGQPATTAPEPAATAPQESTRSIAPVVVVPRVPPRVPTPTLPPPPAKGATGALSWAPPAGYKNFSVKQVTGVSKLNVVDGRGGDVLVQLPRDRAVGPVTIKNCRNAVLIGGEIQVAPALSLGGQDQRGVYVTGCTGTVHIEGVRINGNVPGSEADGIAVNAPKAIVQIENVRVDGMRGGKSSNHADVFQPWGGVREFRIDRLTGSTNYQGLHIGVDLGPIGGGTIRNTNIASSGLSSIDHGGNFIWLQCNAYPLALDNVYVSGRSGRSFASSIWPTPAQSSCPAVVRSGTASWPAYKSLTGGVQDGTPSTGDFLPPVRSESATCHRATPDGRAAGLGDGTGRGS
jgi:hypothetical protein